MKKTLCSLAFFALSLLLFCSCDSTPQEKSDSEILNEISQLDSYFCEYDLSVDSYEITKRQTNPDDKTDYIWISLSASNDFFTYTNSYELMYVLYNDGWLLEDYDDGHALYEVIDYNTITQADADQVMASSEFDQWEFHHRENKTNRAVFYYTASVSQYYLKTDYLVAVTYQFTPYDLWGTATVSPEETQRTPDFLGEWVYQDDTRDFWVNITSVDLNKKSITLEYRLNNITLKGTYSLGSHTGNLSSDGTITLPLYVERNSASAKI